MQVLSGPSQAAGQASSGVAGEKNEQGQSVKNIRISSDDLSGISGMAKQGESAPLSPEMRALKTTMETFSKRRAVSDAASSNDDDIDVDVRSHVSSSPLLKAAAESAPDRVPEKSVIPKEDRTRFLNCVASGGRYTETFDLFSGNMRLKIRCRSVDETEAIEAYVRRQVTSGAITSQADYSSLVRRTLLVAQVAELNGVSFPEMRAPLRFVETGESLTPPAWEEDLKLWGTRPESVVSAVLTCLFKFETKYWTMVRKSADANFWKTGEYIEE